MYGSAANAGAQNVLNAEGDLFMGSFPDASLPPQDVDRKVRVTYLDWVIVIIGHGVLLFPFPGWPLLYLQFEQARQIYTPVLGTLFSIVSIQPGVQLLARARENPDKLDLWIFYAFAVSIVSMTALFLTIGAHVFSFIPILVLMLSIGGAAYWEKRKRLQENVQVQVPTVSVFQSRSFQWRPPPSLPSETTLHCTSPTKF